MLGCPTASLSTCPTQHCCHGRVWVVQAWVKLPLVQILVVVANIHISGQETFQARFGGGKPPQVLFFHPGFLHVSPGKWTELPGSGILVKVILKVMHLLDCPGLGDWACILDDPHWHTSTWGSTLMTHSQGSSVVTTQVLVAL